MDYSMIGKIEKARRYAEERDRFTFKSFSVQFRGVNNNHTVAYGGDGWSCDCEYFETHGVCAHTMALERVLEPMIESPVN